ncbi:MAG: hypothetical protein ACPGXX_06605, partial [Planctomycetaceae bacterium]
FGTLQFHLLTVFLFIRTPSYFNRQAIYLPPLPGNLPELENPHALLTGQIACPNQQDAQRWVAPAGVPLAPRVERSARP